MKQYLLPESGSFYKVNMHSHSNLSDGRQTPEELKEAYKALGYSAIAFTEHGHLHNLSHLTDDDFVAIVSYEMDLADKENVPFKVYDGAPKQGDHMHVIHMNLYAKDPKQTERPSIGDLREKFCIENVNEAIRRGKEMGFLVVYNHPHWSLNTHAFYTALEGVDGLEIINGASQRSSDLDYAAHVYDEMMWAGKRLPMCVSGDDNHDKHAFGLAWTMVKAESLTYENLLTALEKGDSYSSEGPEIYDLYVEDGVVRIRCSEAVGIFYTGLGRKKQAKLSEHGAPPVTEAAFRIGENDHAFRITVKDASGKRANTRYYYLDELKA
jgi:hypothetical protein